MAAEATQVRKREKSFYPAYFDERDVGDLPQKAKTTVDEFVSAEYLPYISGINKSWKVDEHILRRYVSPVFGCRKFGDIRRSEVISWFRSLVEKGFDNSTSNRIMATFKALCSFAETRGILPFGNAPCYKIPHLPVEKKRKCLLSPEETARLKEALEKSSNPQALALRLLILTGARKREILDARWEDVDLGNKRLRVTSLCSNNPRYIALNNEAMEILMSIYEKKNNESGWVFPGRKEGKPLSDIYAFWNVLRNELGLGKVKINDLRNVKLLESK